MKKGLKIVTLCSLLLIAAAWIAAAVYSSTIARTYDGSKVDVTKLYENPTQKDLVKPDGAAAVIVQENLDKTNAANDVASIVFDFRGFDTLGESFILLTAIAGSFVILSRHKKAKKNGEEESHEV